MITYVCYFFSLKILFSSRIFIIFLFVLFYISVSNSQPVIISGNAPDYANDELVFFTYQDFITQTPIELGRCKVLSNGDFTCCIHITHTTPAYLLCGVFKGTIVLEPGMKYEAVLPYKTEKSIEDYLNPYFKEVVFYITNGDSVNNELNYLIQKFNNMFEDSLQIHFNKLYKLQHSGNIDSSLYLNYTGKRRNPTKKDVQEMIKNIDYALGNTHNEYFNVYKEYKYAFLKHITYQRDVMVVTREYLQYKSIYYFNEAYISFFNQLFRNFLANYSLTKEGARIITEIEYAKSLTGIKKVLNQNPALEGNDTLQELIVLRGLYDAYYSSNFSIPQMIQILDSVEITSPIPLHKTIASNIKKKIVKFQIGHPVPFFDKFDTTSKPFIYLHFYNQLSYAARQDLEALKITSERYNKFLQVITIAVGADFEKTKKYLNEKKCNWQVLNFMDFPDILKEYEVRIFPTYYLVDNKGNLVLSPTPSPNENFDAVFLKLIKNKGY